MRKIIFVLIVLPVLTAFATRLNNKQDVFRVPLGEVVNEKFFRSVDSVLKKEYNSGDCYFELYFHAYADSMFPYDGGDKYFNNDSIAWIVIFAPPYIMSPKSNYLVTYNQSKYLIPINIGNQGNLIKPLNKTKRICQEFEFTYYHLFPTLLLWHPSGKVDKIPKNTDLFYRITE